MRKLTAVFLLLATCTEIHAQWSPGGAGTTGTISRQGKVILNSTGWDDHLEISRGGFGGIFKPDGSTGYRGLRLDLTGTGSNFYVLNGYVGIGTTAPSYPLHVVSGPGGELLKFQRGTGIVSMYQDPNASNLYLDAPSGLLINPTGGNVGIGTGASAPIGTLHVKSNWASINIEKGSSSTEATLVFSKAGSPLFYFWSDNQDDDALKIMNNTLSGEHDGVPRMEFPAINKNIYMVESGGNVGIGTTNPGSFRLAVEGKIGAREVNVTTAAWSDYVFEDNYKLAPLSEVRAYIKEHHHLPDVPSEKEVQQNGQNLGEMNALLLKKIEELTLYVIQQQAEQSAQAARIKDLESKITQITYK